MTILNTGDASIKAENGLIIVKGLSQTVVKDFLTKYKTEKEKGHVTYSRILWLGSDDVKIT